MPVTATDVKQFVSIPLSDSIQGQVLNPDGSLTPEAVEMCYHLCFDLKRLENR